MTIQARTVPGDGTHDSTMIRDDNAATGWFLLHTWTAWLMKLVSQSTSHASA